MDGFHMVCKVSGVRFREVKWCQVCPFGCAVICCFLLVCPPSNLLSKSWYPPSMTWQCLEFPLPMSSNFSKNKVLSQLPDADVLYASPPCICLSYCYWVEMWCRTLAPIGIIPVPRVESRLRPTKMAYFARYVWYGIIDFMLRWVLMITPIGAKLKKDGSIPNAQWKPFLFGMSQV